MDPKKRKSTEITGSASGSSGWARMVHQRHEQGSGNTRRVRTSACTSMPAARAEIPLSATLAGYSRSALTASRENFQSARFSNARRCTSDTALWRARPSPGIAPSTLTMTRHSSAASGGGFATASCSRFSANRRQATILMATRSNAKGVADMVATIRNKCQAGIPPSQSCSILAHVADDAYYRVVIGSAGGVEVMTGAMKAFPHDAPLQEACCNALGRLCERNGMNQTSLENNGGIACIVAAMRNHPSSIAVQSAACEALRSLSALITPKVQPSRPVPLLVTEIVKALEYANVMYITPNSKAACGELLAALNRASQHFDG